MNASDMLTLRDLNHALDVRGCQLHVSQLPGGVWLIELRNESGVLGARAEGVLLGSTLATAFTQWDSDGR